jgi:predicted permease
MRAWHIVVARLRSLVFHRQREADLREELQFHLDREAERLQAMGLSPEAARAQAWRAFGGVEQTKEECRDMRGRALLDGIVRDVRFAARSLRRAPLVSMTIVATVGLGLGLMTSVFTICNTLLFRADDVRAPHELFAVVRQQAVRRETDTFTTREGYEALLRETRVFSGAFATTTDVAAWIEGVKREGRLVSGNAFDVLGVDAARGRALTTLDDEAGRPPVLVLSHRSWEQHYGSDPGLIDRTVRVNGAEFRVVGVMPEGFRGLEFAAPDYWAPLALADVFRPGGTDVVEAAGVNIVGRLAPGVSQGQAQAELAAWESQDPARSRIEPRLPPIVLEPRPGTVPVSRDTVMVFAPLFFAFGLVLMIACANVANLLLARGVARQREIGMRFAIGASRRRVVGQLLTEGLTLALVAAVLGLAVSRVLLEGVVRLVVSTFPAGMGSLRIAVPDADWRVLLFLVAGACASTLIFALAPAIQATRVELVRAIRGEVMNDSRPGRPRNVLIVLQVAASVLLLVCAAIFLRSTWAATRVDSGLRVEGLVTISVADEARRGAVLDVVTSEPAVQGVAAAWPSLLENRRATAEVAGERTPVTYQGVSPTYFQLLGVPLVRGRAFLDVERDARAGVAVVSQSVATRLWPGADAIGQVLRLDKEAGATVGADAAEADGPLAAGRSFTIVGVARDVTGFRMGGSRLGGADVYVPVGPDVVDTALVLATRGGAEQARRLLVDRLARVHPNIGDVSTLDAYARMEAYLLAIPMWLTLGLGTLALSLTVSGLFSVLSYLVEQRAKEFGVRMALGATGQAMARLVLSQLARPVGLGLFLGVSFTAVLGRMLLATPASEAIGDSVQLLDPVAYAASVCAIVIACLFAALVPTWKAGHVDPVVAIRRG